MFRRTLYLTAIIEEFSYNVSTGLYDVFDVQGEVNKNAIVPILLRTEEAKHYHCVAAVYRSSSGEGSEVSMRLLVTRALTGVCDNCYYYSQCVVTPSSKGQPEQLKSQTPTKLSDTENVFPCRMNGTFDQLQCLVFIRLLSKPRRVEAIIRYGSTTQLKLYVRAGR